MKEITLEFSKKLSIITARQQPVKLEIIFYFSCLPQIDVGNQSLYANTSGLAIAILIFPPASGFNIFSVSSQCDINNFA